MVFSNTLLLMGNSFLLQTKIGNCDIVCTFLADCYKNVYYCIIIYEKFSLNNII